MPRRCAALSIAIWLVAVAAPATGLRICAASNLRGTLEEIAAHYEDARHEDQVLGGSRQVEISITYGSTAKLYAQVVHGAPFDLFFGADVEHARRLEDAGLAIPGSRFTYALGRLALWSRAPVDEGLEDRLVRLDFEHLAMASPRLAPYGRAAREVLERRDLWDRVEPRVVYGEDVGKAFHFVESGAAELGFAPLSLVRRASVSGTTWIAPPSLHSPIEQQAAQLRESETGREFLDFVRSAAARDIFERRGYALP